MNFQLSLERIGRLESYTTLNSPLNTTSRRQDFFKNYVPTRIRRKSRSQQKIFYLQPKTTKDILRRKSCCCDQCGQLGAFQFKCMNIKGPKPYRKVLLTRRASNQYVYLFDLYRQSAKPKSVQRIKQALKKMKTYDESKLNSIEPNRSPVALKVIQESMNKLQTYFTKQKQQQMQIYQLTQFTPSSSPKHARTPRNLPYLSSYMTYRKIDSQLLRPLKPMQQQSQRSQLLTLHRTKHHKTQSTAVPY